MYQLAVQVAGDIEKSSLPRLLRPSPPHVWRQCVQSFCFGSYLFLPYPCVTVHQALTDGLLSTGVSRRRPPLNCGLLRDACTATAANRVPAHVGKEFMRLGAWSIPEPSCAGNSRPQQRAGQRKPIGQTSVTEGAACHASSSAISTSMSCRQGGRGDALAHASAYTCHSVVKESKRCVLYVVVAVRA